MRASGDGTDDLVELAASCRQEWELVARYHAALRHAGVVDYDLARCWDAYQRSREAA